MTTAALPVALVGDGLRVPCADGAELPYLSFDAAASTSAMQQVLDAVEAFLPWYSSVHGGVGYKSEASVLAYESSRLPRWPSPDGSRTRAMSRSSAGTLPKPSITWPTGWA